MLWEHWLEQSPADAFNAAYKPIHYLVAAVTMIVNPTALKLKCDRYSENAILC